MGDWACEVVRVLPGRLICAVRQLKVPPQGFFEDRTNPSAHHFNIEKGVMNQTPEEIKSRPARMVLEGEPS